MEVIIIPIITALVEMIKIIGIIPQRLLPLLSTLIGVGFGYTFFEGKEGILLGLVFGLASCGLFDMSKNTISLLTKNGK